MGWDQYVILKFFNYTTDYSMSFSFPDSDAHSGYPFDASDLSKRTKIEYDSIRNKEIGPRGNWAYGQTGKQNEWAGPQGSITLWMKSEGSGWQSIATVEYECPWSGSNSCNLEGIESDWVVTRSTISTSGNLGWVNIMVRHE